MVVCRVVVSPPGPPPKPPPKPRAVPPSKRRPQGVPRPKLASVPGTGRASNAALEPETLLEDSIVTSDTHERMRTREDEGPTSDVIPLLSVPLPGKEADKYIGCTIDGRYVVQSVLGEGGMGVVYKCRRRVFEKTVAVKILRSDLAKNHEVTERFATEAKAASNIGNAHIVDVFDFGELPDGSTYFAMEYLDGPSLADLLEPSGSVPAVRVVEIGRQLAEGLAAAHEAGIVHRDLKPDNVFLVDKDGREFVKIVDFGIAKVAGLQNKITRAGAIFGTPHYMAPEQCRGSAVDARTDIYSLGVILYELLTGTVPFDAENPLTILSQHLHDPPAPPSTLDRPPQLPGGLEAVILRCLEKDPDQRFQSMGEVAEALEAIGRGSVPEGEIDVPISVAPPSRESETELPFELTAPVSEALPAPPPSSRLDLQLDAAVRDAEIEKEWKKAHSKRRWPWILAVAAVLALGVVGYGMLNARVASMPQAVLAARPLLLNDFLGSKDKQPVKKTIAVALVLSPIDAHVFQGKKDLGTMPITLDVPENEPMVVRVKRAGYWPRKIKIDGKKEKLLIRLAPIPGSGLAVPTKERTAEELGFDEADAPEEATAEPEDTADEVDEAPAAKTPPDKTAAKPAAKAPPKEEAPPPSKPAPAPAATPTGI